MSKNACHLTGGLSPCDDERDMGGIENISPVLKPLCTKVFQKITGEMIDFSVTHRSSTSEAAEPSA